MIDRCLTEIAEMTQEAFRLYSAYAEAAAQTDLLTQPGAVVVVRMANTPTGEVVLSQLLTEEVVAAVLANGPNRVAVELVAQVSRLSVAAEQLWLYCEAAVNTHTHNLLAEPAASPLPQPGEVAEVEAAEELQQLDTLSTTPVEPAQPSRVRRIVQPVK